MKCSRSSGTVSATRRSAGTQVAAQQREPFPVESREIEGGVLHQTRQHRE